MPNGRYGIGGKGEAALAGVGGVAILGTAGLCDHVLIAVNVIGGIAVWIQTYFQRGNIVLCVKEG